MSGGSMMLQEKTGNKKSTEPRDQEATIQQLKEKVYLLESILDSIPVSIYWKDKNGVYIGRNQYAAEISYRLGIIDTLDKDFAIGLTDYHAFSKETADMYRTHDKQVMTTGEPLITEETIELEGKKHIQLSTKNVLHSSKGEVAGIIGYTMDITDKRKSQELHKKQEIAQETISYLKTMAASISHELRNPIAGARRMFSDIFQKIAKSMFSLTKATFDKKDISIIEQQLQKSVKHTQDGMRFVDTALTIMSMQLNNVSSSKIDKSRFTTCTISSVIDEALGTYYFQDHQKELVNWENKEDFEFTGESTLSRHIVWNLLKNALRAIEESGKGKIFIWIASDDEYNYLHFKDTAQGMPVEVAAHVFDQFYTKSEDGTGLGLSFCKTVMQSYEGDIACYAKDGEYAEFILKFPID